MNFLKIAEDFCKKNKLNPIKLGDYQDPKDALVYVYLKMCGINKLYSTCGRDVKNLIEFFLESMETTDMTKEEINAEMQLVLNGDENNIGILACVDFIKNHKHFVAAPKHLQN